MCVDEQLKKHQKQVQLIKVYKNQSELDFMPMQPRKTQKHVRPKKK